MALTVNGILGGGGIKLSVDGVEQTENMNLQSFMKAWNSISTLPYSYNAGSVVVYENELHLLGGSSSDDNNGRTDHYKWNGTSWESVSTIPYYFAFGSAEVLDDGIHVLGGASNPATGYEHYIWNGTEWYGTKNSYSGDYKNMAISYKFGSGCSVILNGEIHVMGGNYSDSTKTKHYKWNGSSWTSVSTLPYSFYDGSATVLNNEIHILSGSGSGGTNHYKWDGSAWTSVSTLPYTARDGKAITYQGEIYLIGGYGDKTGCYKWDGSAWTKVSTLPFEFSQKSAVVYNNTIHLFDSTTQYSIYEIYKEV